VADWAKLLFMWDQQIYNEKIAALLIYKLPGKPASISWPTESLTFKI